MYTGVKCKKCGAVVSTHINGYCIVCHCNGDSKSLHDEFVEDTLEALKKEKFIGVYK